MTTRTFVDSSVWFAALVVKDARNAQAKSLLADATLLTTDHVVVETCLLLASRHSRQAALAFWDNVRSGSAEIEFVTSTDLERAWEIAKSFPDQDFSIVDCTSFAVMERLGVDRAASFDHHFVVYRFGPRRDRAFEVLH